MPDREIIGNYIENGIDLFGDIMDMEQIGPNMGKNPGGMFKDPKSTKLLYVKRYPDRRQTSCEFISNRIYSVGGVPVLDGYIIRDGSSIAYATEFQPDFVKLPAERRHEAQKFFVLACYLLDWDAVGTTLKNPYCNLQTNSKGELFLVDHGGSLLFRGYKRLKSPSRLVFDDVLELETMRSSINPTSQAIFKDITEEEIARQAKELVKNITEQLIQQIINVSLLDEEKEFIRDLLFARRKALIKKYA